MSDEHLYQIDVLLIYVVSLSNLIKHHQCKYSDFVHRKLCLPRNVFICSLPPFVPTLFAFKRVSYILLSADLCLIGRGTYKDQRYKGYKPCQINT